MPPRYYNKIRNHCLKLPDTTEIYQWECNVLKFKKRVFAICSDDGPLAITLKPRRENLDAYLYHPNIEIARYVGRYGWITITVEDKDTAALALSLVLESYAVISECKTRRRKGKR